MKVFTCDIKLSILSVNYLVEFFFNFQFNVQGDETWLRNQEFSFQILIDFLKIVILP